MAKKRVFISFAMEDKKYRDFLVGQSRFDKSPFEFIDMSVKNPWENSWKTNCRIKIRGCDGVIALVSKYTASASGALWEIKCAGEEKKPLLAIYCSADNRPARLPTELSPYRIHNWTWSNIDNFIASL